MITEIKTAAGSFTITILSKKDISPFKGDTEIFFLKLGTMPDGSDIIPCLRSPDNEKVPIAFTGKKYIEEFLSYQSEHFIKSKNRFALLEFPGSTLALYFKTSPKASVIINPPKEMDFNLKAYIK